MKKVNFLFLLIISLFLISCNATISSKITKSYPTTDYEVEMRLFDLDEIIPYEYEIIGTAKAGDSGFSFNCSYDYVIDKLIAEARKAGGNAIKIVKHSRPDFWSSCHRVQVEIVIVKY